MPDPVVFSWPGSGSKNSELQISMQAGSGPQPRPLGASRGVSSLLATDIHPQGTLDSDLLTSYTLDLQTSWRQTARLKTWQRQRNTSRMMVGNGWESEVN